MNATNVRAAQPEWGAIFCPATQRASVAMSRWTRGEIALTLDEVRESPMEDVATMLQLGEASSNLVLMDVAGKLGGQLILVFDDENANRLIASLLGRATERKKSWGELEESALRETGNILGSAYLNCFTALTGRALLPSAPRVTRDYAMSVIQQAILSQALVEDQVLVARTRFTRSGARVEWNLVFVPSPELLQVLREFLASRTWSE